MATRTVYVYAAISGNITSIGNGSYCDGGTHEPCRAGDSNCVDIGGSGPGLYLRVNYPNVQCFIPFVYLSCCSGGTCGDNFKRLVVCDLYGDTSFRCYIGTVAYGHITSERVTHDHPEILTSGSFWLGTVTSGNCPGCSSNPHSHMEMSGGTLQSLYCNQPVGSTTPIYKFTWDNGYCL